MSNATSFSNVPPVPLPSGGLLPVAGAIAPQASPPTQRRTVSAQRFYTPPGSNRGGTQLVGAVPGTYGMVAQCGRASVEEPCDMGNVVVIDSVVAGVGTSTLAALLARELSERGLKCVLVDADLQGGGLDVLLGVENEDGSRFGEISAPLGNIDGKALLRELPIWDGVPLLACDPWKTENPQSWEVQACIHALSQVRSVVVVDMGQWNGLQDLTELRKAIRITVVELTVLGLARAKANLRAHYGSIGEHDAATQEREFSRRRATARNRTRPWHDGNRGSGGIPRLRYHRGHQTGCQALQRTLGRAWTAQTQSYERESHRNVGGSHSGSVGRKEHQSWNSGHLATSHPSRASPTSR